MALGWIGDATDQLRQLAEEAERTRQKAFETGSAFQSLANEVGDIVENDLPQLLDNIVYQIEERTRDAGTRLDDFLFQLKDVAATGNLWAEQLVGVIEQVREGIISAEDAMRLFGNATVQFDGQIRPIQQVLQELLPTLGEVRREIRETTEQMQEEGFTVEDIIGRLRQQHITFAHEFARLLEAFKEGRATLQAVLDAARKLQQAFPDSESAALAEVIQDLLLKDSPR